MATRDSFTVVIPTVGRPSLARLVDDLDRLGPMRVVVVDDRTPFAGPLAVPESGNYRLKVVTSGGRGPAAARNVGWRRAPTEWVAFLDDDVRLSPGWLADLIADLNGCHHDVAGTQGRVTVPLPSRTPPTDWERNVAGLSDAAWITADMAYRRSALEDVGGFDERFTRAYREDSDLALRLLERGWRLTKGRRRVDHPVRPAPWWVSASAQRGNADDALMDWLHGQDWRPRVGAGDSMGRQHLAITVLAASAAGLTLTRRRRPAWVAASLWAGLAGRFAWSRIRPGPRSLRETAAMVATSVLIPPLAIYWKAAGWIAAGRPPGRVEAVLFDRDGTLVVDVPYNGDPDQVTLAPGAAEVMAALRAAGLRVGLVSNQSGVARGLLDRADVEAVNRRLGSLLGGFDTVVYCPHGPDEGCRCRKPAPGLVEEAARRMGVAPNRCVMVGDILADVRAGEAAGARGVLVPNLATDPVEIRQARWVASDLRDATNLLLSWICR